MLKNSCYRCCCAPKRAATLTLTLHLALLIPFITILHQNISHVEQVSAQSSPSYQQTIAKKGLTLKKYSSTPQSSIKKVLMSNDHLASSKAYEYDSIIADVAVNNESSGVANNTLTKLIGELGREVERHQSYPLSARKAGVEGEAILYITLNPEGLIIDTTVKGLLDRRLAAALDKSIMQLKQRWQWRGPALEGSPTVAMPIKYVLYR